MKKLFSHFAAILLLPAVLTVMLITGCSEDPPSVQQLYMQLNVFDDRDKGDIYETLSFWVHPQDEDGIEDIEYLYLIHDSGELVWTLDSESWESEERPGENWLGSNEIIMPDLSPLPRGEYRIIVVDAAGERDERSAYISEPEDLLKQIVLPEAYVEDDVLVLEGLGDSSYHIWLYDQNGSFKRTVTPSKTKLPLSEFLTRRGDEGYNEIFFVYLYDHDVGCGIRIGPFSPAID